MQSESMMNSMPRRVALVTGGCGFIGMATIKALAAKGHQVIGIDIVPVANRRLDVESGLPEGAITFRRVDIRDFQSLSRVFDEIHEGYGGVDILVNNAGIQHVAPVTEFPNEKWDDIVLTNLTAPFYAIKKAIPHMAAKRWGRIINVSSVHGLVASPKKTAYVAAKHGLIGLTKSVALEVGELGITSNAVCPGWVDTPLVQKQISDLSLQNDMPREEVMRTMILPPHTTKRFVTVDEIAGAIAFLAEEASGSINGASLAVDAGWTTR